jgi:hypothetical protein
LVAEKAKEETCRSQEANKALGVTAVILEFLNF